MMKLKAKHQYTCTYDDDSEMPRDTFFTTPIGQNTDWYTARPLESGGMSGLKFECGGRVTDGHCNKELSFHLDQLFPPAAHSKPSNDDDTEKSESDRIFSCNWSLKVRAVIRKGTEVIFDSRGENEGGFTEVWGTCHTRRNIHTVVLGRDGGVIYNFLARLQPEKTLTVEAEVEISAKVHDDNSRQHVNMMRNSRATGLDMLELLRKDCSDITIKCDSVDFKAHKVVLKSYSPVFARMLDSPMDESATSLIHISDFEPETIQDLITFMYEGTLNTCSKDSIVAMLDCAEKYDISELKVAVIKEMLARITPDSAAQFAAALTTFRADERSKQAIFDYVKTNLPQLRTNSHFRQFFKENVQFLL